MGVLALIELRVKPESIDAMKAWLNDGLPDTRAAEGCEGVTVHANLDDRSNLARIVGMLSENLSVRSFEIVGL